MELHAKEDHKDPELLLRHAKHIEKAKTEARAAHKKHQEEVSERQKDEALKLLREVLHKHAHQHNHGFRDPASVSRPDAELRPEGPVLVEESLMKRTKKEGSSEMRELDDAVSSKLGFVTDAYNEATDKASFVANTVIDTVETAMAILTQGFDFGASCPDIRWPSASADEDRVKIFFGRQKCQATLVGQTITLFDFNFGEKSFKWPGPIATIAKLGFGIAECAKTGGTGALSCFAKMMANTLMEVVPPFNFLSKLEKMMEEFIEVFAFMASKVVEKALDESAGLIQEAAQTKFPEVGAAPVVKKFHKNFELRLSSRKGRPHPRASEASKPEEKSPAASLVQGRDATQSGGDDKPEGALGFGAADYVPQAQKLITQFNGVETDSGSCLAFAPSSRRGSGNTVTPRDWQTPSQSDVPEFIKLEPWAVPCTNEWMKDNPNKWQGYSFYIWDTPVERCATVVYSLGLQPVLAFVGGIEFDIMPAPIAEVETLVCWPETQPGGVDLSAIEMHIMSGGVPLLTRTLRLKKRFGSGTGFSGSNIRSSTASGRLNFGVPEDGADDSALNAMSRDSLLQTASNSTSKKSDFEVEQEHYLAAMDYDMLLGPNITESWRGADAARRLKPLFPNSGVTFLEAVSGSQGEEHILFSLRSPNTGLVGFEIQGVLRDCKLELSLQMQFGPFTSPKKRFTIMDLKLQLAAILTAIPFISAGSKVTALQAMTDFDILAEAKIPTESDTFSHLTQYWLMTTNGNNHDHMKGQAIYWDNGEANAPFSQDPKTVWRLVSDLHGEYWLVTGEGQNPPNKCLYVANGKFHVHNFWEDPKTKWLMRPAGNDEFWLVTGPNHHDSGKMLCLNPSWQAYGAWSDPACKFRLTEMAFGLKPFMLQPAENWIVGAKGHRDYENYMIFWKESEGGTYIYRYNGDNRCRWVLKPKGGGEYWLITGSQTEEPGKMLYVSHGGFHFHNAWDDPKCTWQIVSAGGGDFWLATSANHHEANRMVYINNGQWSLANFWHDPATKFRFLLHG